MSNIVDFQKIKTGIKGLDALFFGGLQLGGALPDSPGIVIVIKGARGLHKTMLAVQMMHGLTKSLKYAVPAVSKAPRLYSLNKRRENIEDMLLDYVISSQIETAIKERHIDRNQWGNSQLCSFLFKSGQENLKQKVTLDTSESPVLPCDIYSCTDRYVCERAAYYNIRTNALHFRRLKPNDDACNLLFTRKYDSISEYVSSDATDRDGSIWGRLPESVKSNFFRVDIDPDIKKNHGATKNDNGDGDTLGLDILQDYFTKKDMQRIYDIVLSLNERKSNTESDSSPLPCVVIDGFSKIPAEQLSKLHNIGNIIKLLKRKAVTSILVFDERMDEMCGEADIIIDMRENVSEQEGYTYSELRISKSVFQEHALGWHQFKKKDTGIEVYPSIHKILHHRYFHLNSRRYGGVLDLSYPQYLEMLKIIYNQDGEAERDNFTETIKDQMHYSAFEAKKPRIEQNELDRLAGCRGITDQKASGTQYLGTILFPSINNDKSADAGEISGSLYPITAYIGNPNTFKGHMLGAGTFHYALQGRDTLAILLDRNEYVMRRYFECPVRGQCPDRDCRNCFSHIHLFPLRMGCISADEFFYSLDERLGYFRNGGRNIRITMDNLHNIDYCFPFIESEKLFVPALINFCHERNIQLDVVCDKKASMREALCLLADNVICLDRRNDDTDNVTLLIEKLSYPDNIRKHYALSVKGVSKMFRISDGELVVNPSTDVRMRAMGNMKDFWRQKYGVVEDRRK